MSSISNDISMATLQTEANDHKKMMILGGVIALAGIAVFAALGYFAVMDNLQVRNLNDHLKWAQYCLDHGNSVDAPGVIDSLQASIHKTTMIGWLNFGFSLASFAIGIFAYRFAAHHHVERRKKLGTISGQQESHKVDLNENSKEVQKN